MERSGDFSEIRYVVSPRISTLSLSAHLSRFCRFSGSSGTRTNHSMWSKLGTSTSAACNWLCSNTNVESAVLLCTCRGLPLAQTPVHLPVSCQLLAPPFRQPLHHNVNSTHAKFYLRIPTTPCTTRDQHPTHPSICAPTCPPPTYPCQAHDLPREATFQDL